MTAEASPRPEPPTDTRPPFDANALAPKRTAASIAIAAIKQMRPKQWTKNGLLFAALLFSGRFFVIADIAQVVLAFAAFCMLSSAGYVLNDWLDREADRKHPKKRHRPIASGALPERLALVEMAALAIGGVALSWTVSPAFLVLALAYEATTLSYSFYFKHLVILDVMFLGACYVWRAVGGAIALDAEVSEWLFLCTAFLALFLGFSKRRAELVLVGEHGGTRKNLAEYSPQMLDQFQGIVTAGTVLSYALYTVLGADKLHGPWMTLTIPYVLYGIFRYIYLVDQRGEGGAPDETFLRDKPILLTVFLYVVTVLAILSAQQAGLISGPSAS